MIQSNEEQPNLDHMKPLSENNPVMSQETGCAVTEEREGMKGRGIPGTTPLVAIALIDIAVNIVCKEARRGTAFRKGWLLG